MLFLRKPTTETIQAFLEAQGRLDLTYAAVGTTATNPPAGYVMDHTRIKLGDGEKVFAAAKTALEHWQQFRLDWLEATPGDTPIQEGQVVAILARSIGLWWLNACRIVAVVNEDELMKRFGFAYGTLPDHAGSGEERFMIEWDRKDDSVWYDILAFSRQCLVRKEKPLRNRLRNNERRCRRWPSMMRMLVACPRFQRLDQYVDQEPLVGLLDEGVGLLVRRPRPQHRSDH